jgi:hypothetical protein
MAPLDRMISRPRNSCSLPPMVAGHADAACALEQERLHLRVGRDGEVGALARLGVEVAHRRRHATLFGIGVGDGKVTVDELTVLVGQVFEALGLQGLADSFGVAGPVLPRDAADGDAAVLAVQRAAEIEIALDLLEVGQNVVPAPARGPAAGPFVVVGRSAAVGHLAIDRGAAAEHARLLVLAQRWAILLRVVVAHDLGVDLEVGPVKAGVEIGRARVAVGDFLGFAPRRRVLAGLTKQDLRGAAGGEPMGHDRPGRAAPHDDVVVHARFPRNVALP